MSISSNSSYAEIAPKSYEGCDQEDTLLKKPSEATLLPREPIGFKRCRTVKSRSLFVTSDRVWDQFEGSALRGLFLPRLGAA